MKTVLPGATIGVLGSGQLGRMFALAARSMGYRVHTFSPDDADTPTGQIADQEIKADYLDLDRVREFARAVDVVTFEFENVPAATVAAVAEIVSVRPGGESLHTTQHRLREKSFLQRHNFPVATFRHVTSAEELQSAIGEIKLPAVLKTAGWGYDGKGQRTLNDLHEADEAFRAIGATDAVLEKFIRFEREISVVVARGVDGAFADYGVIENAHRNHILDYSIAPAQVSARVSREAIEIAREIARLFDYIGVLCVEFFLTADEKIYVNEIAPRPHNSGHLTIDACVTNQFEQQVRAVCGLPLGSTEQLRPAAMVNLLGDLWHAGEPDWHAACAVSPHVKLHLYGKRDARPRRKMGHLTALAASSETTDDALQLARAAREQLVNVKSPKN